MASEENKDPLGHSQPGEAIDINKILLPKKEQSLDSAQRTPAGALLAQEQQAAQQGFAPQQVAPAAPPAPAPAAPTPAPAPEPKKDSGVSPLQTFQGDIASIVEKTQVSMVSIATAEAKRREQLVDHPAQAAEARPLIVKAALIVGGVLLLSGALGAVAYIATRPTTVPAMPLNIASPFITVDDTTPVIVPSGITATAFMQELNNTRTGVHLSLGLIDRLELELQTVDAQGNQTAADMSVQAFITTLAPFAPSTLVRTLSGPYLLGVHSYDENEAFLILHTDSYETAYAGMLAWESTMRTDLSPMFVRTAPVRSNDTATTTQQAQVLPTTFTDKVVANHDARVIQNKYGDIVLLWTFINRNTLVIANNDATLREILTRTAAPAQGLPQ